MRQFSAIWADVCQEQPASPTGAAGELIKAIAEKLGIEELEYAQAKGHGALFLLDLSKLGFKDFDINVVMVAHPPLDWAQAKAQADFLFDCRHALDSQGFCFFITASPHAAPPHPQLPEGAETIHLGGADIERLLASSAPAMVLFEIIRRQVRLERLCPFNTTHEARADTFRGRKQDLNRLIHQDDTTFLIMGARRIGKTSLLKRAYNMMLQRERGTINQRVFFFNCLTWGDYLDCAARLSHDIDPHSERRITSGRSISYMLERSSLCGRRRLILLFDEMDGVVERDMETGWRFFNVLAEAVSKGWIRAVFAGYRSVHKLYVEYDEHRETFGRTPFHGALEPLELSALSREETNSLIREPFHQIGFAFTEEAAFLNQIWEYSSGHPFIVQFLGEKVFRLAQEQANGQVNLRFLEEVVNGNQLADFLETHFMENTMFHGQPIISERLCMLSFAHAKDSMGWSMDDFLQGCKKVRPATKPDEVHNALRALTHAGLLTRQGGYYTFSIPLIGKTLRVAFSRIEAVLE